MLTQLVGRRIAMTPSDSQAILQNDLVTVTMGMTYNLAILLLVRNANNSAAMCPERGAQLFTAALFVTANKKSKIHQQVNGWIMIHL